MPLINLIQEQRLESRRRERKARSFFLLFVVAAVASGGGWVLLAFQTDSLRSEETRLISEAQKAEPMLSQIENNKRLLAETSPKLKTLEDAHLQTARWGRILKHVATQTPPKTWLTALRAASPDPDKAVTITFMGMAGAQEPIGEFILRLHGSQDLQTVNLKFTSEKVVQNTKGIEFQIDSEVTGTAADKPKKEEEKS